MFWASNKDTVLVILPTQQWCHLLPKRRAHEKQENSHLPIYSLTWRCAKSSCTPNVTMIPFCSVIYSNYSHCKQVQHAIYKYRIYTPHIISDVIWTQQIYFAHNIYNHESSNRKQGLVYKLSSIWTRVQYLLLSLAFFYSQSLKQNLNFVIYK